MAIRPVYAVKCSVPYYSVFNAEFAWTGGFALSQSRKNICAMHECFERRHPGKKALEISSKSELSAGVQASALNLELFVPSKGKAFPVECCYQSSKVFACGGPFEDLLTAAPRDAKRDARLSSHGRLVCFRFEGAEYPLAQGVGFYDFIYIRALVENSGIADVLPDFDAFTDITFNPGRSCNCQARSAAVFVGLHRAGRLGCLGSFDEFMHEVGGEAVHAGPAEAAETAEPDKPVLPAVRIGSAVIHPVFGKGVVTAVIAAGLRIDFGAAGEKTLSEEWVTKHCGIAEG